ncbi:histone-lysine N-methyltransferase PRDM16-like [Microplitis demolitor]|uniref:histone-lysine N-methyltransferase PRDM16-like n=1 Tax=Microplitis demolitor TaxID=69319 RepID=UPI00235B6EA1|nr:histone-lysine N-methyltransferase PRDM16-like [Microplitis demolitor]
MNEQCFVSETEDFESPDHRSSITKYGVILVQLPDAPSVDITIDPVPIPKSEPVIDPLNISPEGGLQVQELIEIADEDEEPKAETQPQPQPEPESESDPDGEIEEIRYKTGSRSQTSKLICKFCNKIFTAKIHLSRHMKLCCALDTRSDSNQIMFSCYLCAFKSHLNINIVRHIKNVHESNVKSRYKCELCGYHSNYKSHVKRHLKSIHHATEDHYIFENV